MSIARQRRPSVKLDMTPLIDCVFLLLIFFMLSSTTMIPLVKLTLPVSDAEAASSRHPVIVAINDRGEVYVNHEQVKLEELAGVLRQVVKDHQDKVVTIRGDKDMKYDLFVRALDAARSSGAIHINIAHETE